MILDPKDSELHHAFREIPEGPVGLDPETGETWRYLGTIPGLREWLHVFEHRAHPATGGSRTIRIPASRGWHPAVRQTQMPSEEAFDL